MFIADFHIHSKYSRATSKDCGPEELEFWARCKGINVIGTGDFTHPAWREELKEKLVPAEEGLYVLKNDFRKEYKVAGADVTPRFVVTGEISSIYKKNGKVRKVHNLILLPGLEAAEAISRRLEVIGNLHSDGRPILGLDSRDLLEIVLDCCPEAIFIPAHIWTPHFSLFGAYSGFDDIRECFGDLTSYIYALETGLSSDPPMNWRLSALDNFTLVSNSDAHSPAKLGREANIFATELSYSGMLRALKNRRTQEFYGTIEFFPEEGKYHYDGHRACQVCWKPSDTITAGGICPVCGGRITVGVLHRVEELADREEGFRPPMAKHFESLVPLGEVIASAVGYAVTSKRVKKKYQDLIGNLGPEFFILRAAPLNDIDLAAGPCIAESIRRLRNGQVDIRPGFDGEYGRIKIIDQAEIDSLTGQLCFFPDKNLNIKDKSYLPSPKVENKKAAAEAAATQLMAAESPKDDPSYPAPIAPGSPFYGLNEEQWAAVSSPKPVIAVIAGPGTGKTKTLVSRIAYLVERCGVHPSQVTAVTFTNKAAAEMRSRLNRHFEDRQTAKAMTIGTFHSIGLQILSAGEDPNKINIIDEYNALAIITEILQKGNLKVAPREVLRGISLLKNGAFPANADKMAIPAGVYDSYCAQLKRYGVMDYDDILREVLYRFEPGKADDLFGGTRENPFSYLLVDEFQDINELQYRLLKAWGQKSESIFIIGDPDQAIYGFRGSDSHYFEKFNAEFSGVRPVRLTKNYRSTPEIISSAQTVIAKETAGERAGSLQASRKSGLKVRLVETNSEFSEALFVAKEINRLVGGIDMLDTQTRSARPGKKPKANQPRGFSDIAVLYRTNRQAKILEQCLAKEGIQYVVAGRDEFLAEKPVREAIAFFKFLLNPADIVSLLVCLRAKNRCSAELIAKILAGYMAGDKSVASFIKVTEELQIFPAKREDLRLFIAMLKKYQPLVNREQPGRLIDSWLKDNSLAGIESLELLLNTAVMYNKMSYFIQNIVLGRESDIVRSGSKVYSPEAVSLMTMHAAKGLEFPIVFICGVTDGLIPLKNSNSDADIDEERRLFYVGMTRARDELILLTSGSSPFIADLSDKQLSKENTFRPKPAAQFKEESLFD